MALYQLGAQAIQAVPPTSFAVHGIHERRDLQRILRSAIEIVAPHTMVLAEEFGEWEDSARRIDLLCLAQNGDLVVVELKRNDDGAYMDLQAIRYAAMVSAMTFARAVEAHQRHLEKMGRGQESAHTAILEFLEWDSPREEEFAQDVQIVLAAADFSKELTTAVMWLNDHQLDIRCIRIQPYALQEQLLVDVQQIIPLPEAANYQVQLKEKGAEQRAARMQTHGSRRDLTRYDLTIHGARHIALAKRNMIFHVVAAALTAGASRVDLPIPPSKWLVLPVAGLDGPGFAERAPKEPGGYDPIRWFAETDELFHASGETFALSNQWSGPTMLPLVDEIARKYALLQIAYCAAATSDE